MKNEDYVSYPLALALKKAGFDRECDHVYIRDRQDKDKYEFADWTVDSRNWNKRTRPQTAVSAPTLSQAQKWLREKRKIIVCPEPAFYMGRRPLMGYCYHIYDSSCYRTESPTVYDSYEEALSTGITAALELIEKKGE